MTLISGWHHLTMSTDGAQEDFDFFTKDLGLYSIKRTVLFDGVLPVYPSLLRLAERRRLDDLHDVSLPQTRCVRAARGQPDQDYSSVDPRGRRRFLGRAAK